MVSRSLGTALIAFSCSLVAVPASAQFEYPPFENPYLTVTYGSASRSQEAHQHGQFSLYQEDGAFDVLHSLGRASFIDVSAGVRGWRNIFFGGGYTARLRESRSMPITAFVPHPVQYDAFRRVEGTLSGLEHTEHSVHIHAMWRLEPARGFQIGIFGGPSLFTSSHDFVQGISVEERGGNFADVQIGEPTRLRVTKSGIGAHVGADAVYRVVHHLGVGLMVRYSRASALFRDPERTLAMTAGGLDAGVRLRFGF